MFFFIPSSLHLVALVQRCLVGMSLWALSAVACAQVTGVAGATAITATSSASSSDQMYQDAVTALSQGNTAQAQRLLQEVVQHIPNHAGAWLDLALLHCQLGNAEETEKIFQKIERELQAPESILALMQKTREQGCRVPVAWIKQAQVSVGHASNVNYAPADGVIRFANNAPFPELVLSPNNRPKGDRFVFGELVGVLPASQENLAGAQWQGVLQYKKYQDATNFDSLIVAGGASWRGLVRDLSDTRLQAAGRLFESWEVNAYASHWTMGASAYETSAQVWLNTWSAWLEDGAHVDGSNGNSNSAWQRLSLGLPWRWGIETGLSTYLYPQNHQYNALRWDAKLRSQWRSQWAGLSHVATVAVGLVVDEAIQQRPGGRRFGNTAQAQLETQWTEKDTSVVYLQQQWLQETSPYNDFFFGDTKRAPLSYAAGLRYTHRLAAAHQVYVQGSYQKVQDQINLFSYKNQTLNIGYQWQF